MMKRENRANRPCKYGMTCKYLMTGTCMFSHYEPEEQQGGFQAQNNGRQPYRGNAFFSEAPQNRGKSRNPRNTSRNFRQGNQQNMQNTQYYDNCFSGSKKQEPNNSFCFDFQQGRQCSFGQNCKRKHQFFYESLQKMRRQQFSRQFPRQYSSNISKLESPLGETLAFRDGNILYRIHYDFQNNAPAIPQFCVQLTPSKQKVQFYNQKNGFAYFSYTNQFTKLIDVSCINLSQPNEKITIPNSHTEKVTSFQHLSEEIMISSTLGGEIKIWWKEYTGFVIHQQLTEKFASNYRDGTDYFDILYLDVTFIGSDLIILAGTSDGRVLFWRGNNITDMKFMSYCFHPDQQALVYKALLYQMPQGTGLVALTWNKTSTASSIVFVDLNNEKQVFKKQFISNQSPDLLLTTFEVMDDYILLANKKGEVKIYDLRQSFKKVGEIYHKNTISSVIFSKVEVKSTNVFLKLLYILQKASKQGPGSFSIYLIQ